jgi:hypothetical protein
MNCLVGVRSSETREWVVLSRTTSEQTSVAILHKETQGIIPRSAPPQQSKSMRQVELGP